MCCYSRQNTFRKSQTSLTEHILIMIHNCRTLTDRTHSNNIVMQVEHGESLVTTEHIQQVIDNCRTFTDFIKEGLIEYLDVNEENDSMMALYETGRTHFF